MYTRFSDDASSCVSSAGAVILGALHTMNAYDVGARRQHQELILHYRIIVLGFDDHEVSEALYFAVVLAMRMFQDKTHALSGGSEQSAQYEFQLI